MKKGERIAFARLALDPPIDLLHAQYVNQRFVPHAHDEYVIGVVERGAGVLEHALGTEHHCAGAVIIIPPELVHRGRGADSGAWAYRVMYLPGAYLRKAAMMAGRPPGAPPRFDRTAYADAQVASRLVALHKALLDDAADALAMVPTLLAVLADLVAVHASTDEEAPAPNDLPTGALRAVRTYLDAAYLRPVTIDQLARVAGLSGPYLIRAFHRAYGLPPYTYLELLRVRHARALIERGAPLSTAALMSGFSDQSHLTRRFRRTFGITPGVYARLASSKPARPWCLNEK